jgi:hypothetical protein
VWVLAFAQKFYESFLSSATLYHVEYTKTQRDSPRDMIAIELIKDVHLCKQADLEAALI